MSVNINPAHDIHVSDSSSRLDATRAALSANLDFHGANGSYGSHAWHPFPAKFPPQLPAFMIRHLSSPGDLVLDPMVGSGTTLVEAVRLGRRAIGCDIDPLARMIAGAKLAPIEPLNALWEGNRVMAGAREDYHLTPWRLQSDLKLRFDAETQKFIQYWFLPQQQLELLALLQRIESLTTGVTRDFLRVVLSSTIIAKSGGVSLARDLAHTRPHRDTQKKPRSAIVEFGIRLQRNVAALAKREPTDALMRPSLNGAGGEEVPEPLCPASIHAASAANTGLPSASVDLIVTSPPYANNAIDYMRAHKFSLVWFGWKISDLSRIRAQYLGHDALTGMCRSGLPRRCEGTLSKLAERDDKKAMVLRRYFEEMKAVIWEMQRVLKKGRPAVIVVGSSKLRGLDVETHKGLAALGEDAGLNLAGISARLLDRDKRMMPARWAGLHSQIEERMHKEYVIGLVKP